MGANGRDRGLRQPAAALVVGDEIRRLNGAARTPGPGAGGPSMTGDLFAWGARQRRFRDTGSISVRSSREFPDAYGLQRPVGSARGDRRLGRYLYSGSFGPAAPVVREDRGVRRNRAVFLVVIALLAGFVAYRLMSG